MNQQQTKQASDTPNTNDERQPSGGSFDELAHEIAEIGRVWAHYGLTVASRSLATSAQTIELAAGSLERLSQTFAGERATDATADEVAVTDDAVIVDERPERDGSDA